MTILQTLIIFYLCAILSLIQFHLVVPAYNTDKEVAIGEGDPVRPRHNRQTQGGWQLLKDIWYKWFGEQLSMPDAKKRCAREGGSLVKITSVTVNAVLAVSGPEQSDQYSGCVWTALIRDKVPVNERDENYTRDGWKWDQNNYYPLGSFTNWADNEPDDVDIQNCVKFCFEHAVHSWHSEFCTRKLEFFCEKPDLNNGWKHVHVYWQNNLHLWYKYFVGQRVTWEAANAACEQQGAYLAIIRSNYTNLALQTFYYHRKDYWAIRPTEEAWIGLRRVPIRQIEWGEWKWKGTGWYPLEYQYDNWADGQPDNKTGNENCVVRERESMKWNDVNCNKKLNYWCEAGALVRGNLCFKYPFPHPHWRPSHAHEIPEAMTGFKPYELDASQCQEKCNEMNDCQMTLWTVNTLESTCRFYNRTFSNMEDEGGEEFTLVQDHMEFEAYERHLCPETPRLSQYNWTQINGSYYKYFKQEMSWEFARLACFWNGGYLAVITSAEENAEVDALRPSYKSEGSTWIGLHRNNDNEWAWDSVDTQVTWSNWYQDHEENQEFSIAALKYSGETYGPEGEKWIGSRHRGNLKGDFICEKDFDGWIVWRENKYKYFSPRATWPMADKTCKDQGGYLAVIRSEEENTFLHESRPYMRSDESGVKGTWIGLRKDPKTWQDTINTTGWQWQIEANSSLEGYDNWKKNYPTTFRASFCVLLLYHKSGHHDLGGKWVNEQCYGLTSGNTFDKFDFWCEKDGECDWKKERLLPGHECVCKPYHNC